MRTLDRYIAITVGVNCLLTLIALLTVFSVMNLMQELKAIGTGQYGVPQALWFVVNMLPNEAYKLFPATALLGTVLALGAMVSRNEVIVISSAGVSPRRLTWSIMQAVLALVAIATALGELVAAPLAQQARTQRALKLSDGRMLTTTNGLWTRVGSQYINIRAPLPGGALRDVYVYDFDDQQRLRSFIYAQSASYQNDEWRLEGLVENRFTENGVTTSRHSVRLWDTAISPQELHVLSMQPEELSVVDLYRSIEAYREPGEGSQRYTLAFWQRASMPMVTGIMVFLAIPLVLNGLQRTTPGKRILAGALVGIGFQLLNETFGSFASAYGLNPLLSAVTPSILVLFFGLWWIRQVS